MIILSRGINEMIMIGDDIQVKVISMDDCKVLLGFIAPKKIAVHREEIYRRIQRQRA